MTTTFILLECGNMAARRPYRTKIGDCAEPWNSGRKSSCPHEDDWGPAWAAYERGEAGQAGIVDHVSFVV